MIRYAQFTFFYLAKILFLALEVKLYSNSRSPSGVTLSRLRNESVIIIKPQNRKFVFFLLPFTFVWAGGSLYGIYGEQIESGQFDLLKSIFGLPFFAGSLFLVFTCLRMFFEHKIIRMSSSELVLEKGFFLRKSKVNFRWNTISEIRKKGEKGASVLSIVRFDEVVAVGYFKSDLEIFLYEQLKKALDLYNPR